MSDKVKSIQTALGKLFSDYFNSKQFEEDLKFVPPKTKERLIKKAKLFPGQR
ncbi:hypothetical protein [Mucilaginibacter psychrotolerans]|uniref:hypothetical protein n=1 Tax=Mucilaginibacter psychrotolerans TaxID=1524096 RepID=UPI00130524E1|nr:hypothetical protein [Mucilaginibacter psychrotolerans]